MYYPKQIPYLLNQTFQDNMDYTEYNVTELNAYCMCIWNMKSKKLLDETIYLSILPDACIDLIIDFSSKEIGFSGFSRNTQILELNKNVDYMGVRFKPGAFYSIFNRNADSVMDKKICFSDIEKQINLNRIFEIEDREERIHIIKEYLIKKIQGKLDKTFIEFTDILYNTPNEQCIMDIAKNFGYDKRQLFRIFKRQYGISPKVLLNILRLHLCLTLLFNTNKELADIVHICGFYDQSHFIKDVKRYTGISPIQLLKSYQK